MEKYKQDNFDYCKSIADNLIKARSQGILIEYFDDVLDFTFQVNSKKEYMSVKVYVTLGGPNVHICTREKAVKLFWGTDHATYRLPCDVCDSIDEMFQEIYDNQ